MTTGERLTYCLEQIKDIRRDYDNRLKTNHEEAFKYYFAEALGNEVKGRSKVVTSDLSDTIEWIMPSLMRIFASGDEVTALNPVGREDVEPVKYQQELTNYQIRVRNKWFMVAHDWFKDALLLKTGILKYEWSKTTEAIRQKYEKLTVDEMIAVVNEDGVLVDDWNENEDGTFDITIKRIFEDERPLLTARPPEHVGFPITSREIDGDTEMFYDRYLLPKYKIIKRYGEDKFREIEDQVSVDEDTGAEISDELQSRFEDLGGVDFFYDSEVKKWWVYECYFPDTDTGEPRKLSLCGEVVCEDVENDYRKPPFRVITPIKMSHRVVGRSLHDLLKDLQRLRTVLLRQILDNIYFMNNGRFVADPLRINLDDLLHENIPGGVIRGDPEGIQPLLPTPLAPWTFKLWETMMSERENRTGVTRYNQGLDADTLNKTARGIQAIMNASQQRIEMIARIFAEMGVAPLVNDVIDLNIMFLKKATAIRIMNEWVEIKPDNIIGKRDVIVNVGIGTGNKDVIIAQMQQLLGLYVQIAKAGVPIVTSQNVYNAMKEIIRAMSYRNVDDFVTDPKVMDYAKQLMEALPMLAQTLPPPVVMLIMSLLQALGLATDVNQAGNTGTGPGQAAPNQAEVPVQPRNPVVTPDGGGFYG